MANKHMKRCSITYAIREIKTTNEILRQVGTWDPLLQWGNACPWTNLSSSNKIQGNYMELKITAFMCSGGKLWTKRYKKTKKSLLPLLKSQKQKTVLGAKAGYKACPQHSTPPRAGKPPKPPLQPDPRTHSYPHRIWGTSSPRSSGSKQVRTGLHLLPAAASGAPIEPCLNFFSGF